MVGQRKSAPSAVAAKKKVAPKRTREEREEKRAQKEARNYAKGMAQREYAARRARAYDSMRMLQRLLTSTALTAALTIVSVYSEDTTLVDPPLTVCPECHHPMTPDEVLAGFSDDPLVFHTRCPACSVQFPCSSTVLRDEEVANFLWFCPPQTREAYQEWVVRLDIDDDDDTTSKDMAKLFADAPHIGWNAMRYASDKTLAGVLAFLCEEEE